MTGENSNPWRMKGDVPILEVRVTPGSRRNSIGPVSAGRIRVLVTAAAENGKANRSTIELISGWMGIPPSRIMITAGMTNPRKSLALNGVSERLLREKIEELE